MLHEIWPLNNFPTRAESFLSFPRCRAAMPVSFSSLWSEFLAFSTKETTADPGLSFSFLRHCPCSLRSFVHFPQVHRSYSSHVYLFLDGCWWTFLLSFFFTGLRPIAEQHRWTYKRTNRLLGNHQTRHTIKKCTIRYPAGYLEQSLLHTHKD